MISLPRISVGVLPKYDLNALEKWERQVKPVILAISETERFMAVFFPKHHTGLIQSEPHEFFTECCPHSFGKRHLGNGRKFQDHRPHPTFPVLVL